MHLIFDLDGTLIDSLPGLAKALNQSLLEHDLPIHDLPAIRTFIGGGSWSLCQNAAQDQSDSLIDSLNTTFKKHYATEWQLGTTIYDGVMDVLNSIPKEHHLSILSNKPHAFTAEIMKTMFPKGMFDTVLGQREGVNKKPDPKGIFEIIENSDHDDKTAYLIGDSDVDIQTAKNAKIGSIAVSWGFNDLNDLTAINPDHIAHDTISLQSVIQEISSQ